jgi:transcriptional regulator with XRE-family HTH domain
MAHPLKTYRDTQNLTQTQLAADLGVTNITVSRWETGLRKIAPTLVPFISEKTGIPARELRPDLAELLAQP